MVGDSSNDVEAARGAGCPVLVVPYGYREGRAVQELDADGIVESVDDVADRVRYVAPRHDDHPSLHLETHRPADNAAAACTAPLVARVDQPPLALTSRFQGVAHEATRRAVCRLPCCPR